MRHWHLLTRCIPPLSNSVHSHTQRPSHASENTKTTRCFSCDQTFQGKKSLPACIYRTMSSLFKDGHNKQFNFTKRKNRLAAIHHLTLLLVLASFQMRIVGLLLAVLQLGVVCHGAYPSVRILVILLLQVLLAEAESVPARMRLPA